MKLPFRIPALLALLTSILVPAAHAQKPLITAYVFPQNSALQPGQIDPQRITRINYAFANIEDGKLVAGFPTDPANFAMLDGLRKDNSALTILVSVGGWLWSGQFSSVALTPQSRLRFIQSAVEFITRYHLDGLDVDWEYPGEPGAGHAFRSEDKQNFTLLLKELREAFDAEAHKNGRKLYLTIAAGASSDFLSHTEMSVVQRHIDTVNLMAYDFYISGSEPVTGHNAPLYTNPADPQKESADASLRAFEAAGVPAPKLVLGVPFYGQAWSDVPEKAHGLYQPGKQTRNAFTPFSLIESSMLDHGFTRYWDPVSKVPWLYNAQQRTFVSYEDPESLKLKCDYVLNHHLAGIMFWHYADDSSGKLLGAIDEKLRTTAGAQPTAVTKHP